MSSNGHFPHFNPHEFLVDDILPAREVHFLAGPSGAGKSTYLFQFLENWSSGGKVFNHQAHPVPFLYASCDRSLASVHRTIKRVGIKAPEMMMSAGDENIATIDKLQEHILKKYPTAKLLVLDGIASLTPLGKVSDYQTVSGFLKSLSRWCQLHDRTILGIGHSAKTKEGEGYLSPRERILGSVAWGGFAETVIFIEPIKADDTGSRLRRLHLLPRNAREEKFEMELSGNGLLIPSERVQPPSKLKTFINSLDPGAEFSFEEAILHSGASKQYVSRTLLNMTTKGEIVRLKTGVYAVAYPTGPLVGGKTGCTPE